MWVTILYQLRLGNTMFPNIYKGINCKIFLWLNCLLPQNPFDIYSMKQIATASSQGLALLEFFPYALTL